jgi:hypothetical protein
VLQRPVLSIGNGRNTQRIDDPALDIAQRRFDRVGHLDIGQINSQAGWDSSSCSRRNRW